MASNKFIITTTGTLSPVPLAGLGKIPGYTHPTTTDLLEEFTLQEIQDPNSGIQAAIDAGYITAENEEGAAIVNIFNDTTPALIKNNLSATFDPGTNVDLTSGYSVGSQWINIVSDEAWVCVDNTSAGAVWKSTTITQDTDTSADIAALSAAIDNNSSNIGTLFTQDIVLSGAIDNNTTNINSLSSEIDNLSSEYVTLATDQTITGNKIFNSDLTVNGVFTATSATFITTENLGVSSNYITLNTNITGNPTEDAGLAVNRGTSAEAVFNWNETLDQWEIGISGDTLYRVLDTTDLVELEADIAVLSAAFDQHDIDISNLSAAIDQNDADIDTLTAQIVFLSGAIDTNTTDIATNTSNIATISGDIGTLSAGNYVEGNTVADDLIILDSNLNALSGQIGNSGLFTFSASRNNNTATNIYLRAPDGTPTNQAGYVLPYDSTLIAITLATNGPETWTAEIRKNGGTTPIATLAAAGTETAIASALSVSVSQGDEIQFYCNGTNINRPHVMAYFVRV